MSKWKNTEHYNLDSDFIAFIKSEEEKEREASAQKELIQCGDISIERSMLPELIGNSIHDLVGGSAGGLRGKLASVFGLIAFEYVSRKQPAILEVIEKKVYKIEENLGWLEKKFGINKNPEKVSDFEIPTV